MDKSISKEMVRSSRSVAKNCLQCMKSFDIFMRVHVCKRCMKPVCSSCSPVKELMMSYTKKVVKKHRVCKTCHAENDFQRALIKDNNLVYGQSKNVALKWLHDLKIITNVNNEQEIQAVNRIYEEASSIEIIQKVDITNLSKSLSYSHRDFVFKMQQKQNQEEELQTLLVTLINKLASKLGWSNLPSKFYAIALFFLAFATPAHAFVLITHIYENIPVYALEFLYATSQESHEITSNQKSKIVQIIDYLVQKNAIDDQQVKNVTLFLSSVGIELAASMFIDLLSFECAFKAINLMIQSNSFLEIEKVLVMTTRFHRQYIQSAVSESSDSYAKILQHLIRNTSYDQLMEFSKGETPYDEFVLKAIRQSLIIKEIPKPSKEFLEGMEKQREKANHGLLQTEMEDTHTTPKNNRNNHSHHEESEAHAIAGAIQCSSSTNIEMYESDSDDEQTPTSSMATAISDDVKAEFQKQIEHFRCEHEKSEQRILNVTKVLQQKEKDNETYLKLISQKEAEINHLKNQGSNNLCIHNKQALDRLWKELQALQLRYEQLLESEVASSQRHQKEKEEMVIASQNLIKSQKESAHAASKAALESQNKLQEENASLLSILSEREAAVLKKDSEIVLLRQHILHVTDEKDKLKELQEQIRSQLQSKQTQITTFSSGVNQQVAQLHKNIRDLRSSHESALEMQRNLQRWDADKHVLEIEEMNGNLRLHEEIIASLRKELADLQRVSSEQAAQIAQQKVVVVDAEKAREGNDKRITQLVEELNSNQATIDELKKQLEESKQNEFYLNEDVRRLVGFVELRDLRLRDMTSVNNWNASKAAELDVLCAEQRGRVLQLEQITADNTALIESLNARVKADDERYSTETEALKKQLKECQDLLEKEQSELRTTSSQLQSTQEQLSEISGSYAVADKENIDMKAEILSLKQVVVKEAQRANKAEILAENLTTENKRLLELLAIDKRAFEEKLDEKQQEIQRVMNENEEQKAKLHELHHERDQLKHEVHHKEQRIEQIIEENKHREAEHVRLQTTLKERDADVDDRDRIIAELRKQLASTQEELANTQADLNKYLSIFVSVKNTVVSADPVAK